MKNNNIDNFKINFVQRYSFKNFLNWSHNLGEKQNCNMNDDTSNLDWLNEKVKLKNTDSILLIINK